MRFIFFVKILTFIVSGKYTRHFFQYFLEPVYSFLSFVARILHSIGKSCIKLVFQYEPEQ